MPKPLGYYTAHTPGDGTLLDELEQQYGSNFEKMSKRDKFYVIGSLTADLFAETEGHTTTAAVAQRLETLDSAAKVSLIKFLIDQV